MTASDWPDPHAAVVERALKMQKGTILADEVLRLRTQITALRAEHSGACDDMAVCGNCWTAGRIDAAAHAEAQVAAAHRLADAWESDPEISFGKYRALQLHAVLDDPDGTR